MTKAHRKCKEKTVLKWESFGPCSITPWISHVFMSPQESSISAPRDQRARSRFLPRDLLTPRTSPYQSALFAPRDVWFPRHPDEPRDADTAVAVNPGTEGPQKDPGLGQDNFHSVGVKMEDSPLGHVCFGLRGGDRGFVSCLRDRLASISVTSSSSTRGGVSGPMGLHVYWSRPYAGHTSPCSPAPMSATLML